jgi:hypothetical protein
LLWSFGNFSPVLVIFLPFWYIVPRQIWQPWSSYGGTTRYRQCKIFSVNIESKKMVCRKKVHQKKRRASIEIYDLEQVCWHRSCKYFLGKNTL